MADCMTFPETVDEFIEQYGIWDRKEVYTNGALLIPVFRVEQMIDHYFRERTCHGETDTDWYEGKLDKFKCDGCCWNGYVDDGMSTPTIPSFCPNCGARVIW